MMNEEAPLNERTAPAKWRPAAPTAGRWIIEASASATSWKGRCTGCYCRTAVSCVGAISICCDGWRPPG